MNHKFALAFILICAAVMTVFAQQERPYDTFMKDVNITFASLKKNLDSNSLSSAAEDAARLQGLFHETETFWSAFNTKDAMDFSKNAQSAAQAIAAAAKEGDGKKALATYGSIGKFCKGCHDTHREQMPDKSFKIKP